MALPATTIGGPLLSHVTACVVVTGLAADHSQLNFRACHRNTFSEYRGKVNDSELIITVKITKEKY